MKNTIIFTATLLMSLASFAQTKLKFSFNNEDITKIIEAYAFTSGQKFIVDSTVRGKATILNREEIGKDEAFDHLSQALAVNGFAIVSSGDVMVVKNARSAQRDQISVSTELPSAKPQRLATWIITIKNIPAYAVGNDVRMLTSAYGELSVVEANNQLIITDWTSNLQRVAAMIKEVDVPANPAVSKIVAEVKKEKQNRAAKAPKQSKEAAEPKPGTTQPAPKE